MSVKSVSRIFGKFYKYFISLFLFVSICSTVSGQLDIGEELFLKNKMEEARPYLETALAQNPRNERIYLYLGTIYEQLGQYDRAVTLLQRGVTYAQDYLDVMYFNIGNNMFKQNKNVLAVDMYSKAVSVNPDFVDAYLNRANAALRVENFESAAEDYRLYLTLRPDTPQRESIERVLAMLGDIIEDARALAAEQERVRVEAEARRKALLNQVLNSLQNASEGTTNLSAESEDVERVDVESDIVD